MVINLKDQTRPPSCIIVVSDNSTDATISLAAAAGAEVQVSVDNTHKKADALTPVPICRPHLPRLAVSR